MTSFAFVLMLCLFSTASAEENSHQLIYETDVRPILKAYCFHCHGEEKELSGGLDLRLQRLIVRGGHSGAAIVPGKSNESLLVDYVQTGLMPPAEEQQLSEEQIETIVRWVDAGAPVEHPEPEADPVPGELLITAAERNHWAYQPITKPEQPDVSAITESSNPVDAFIADRLEEADLTFSEQADRRTLLRRVTHDLTGLLPTPEEMQAFLSDDSPDAYEKVVDRLLSSPHYGERWGRHWLDAAGYADSEGYNDDDVIRDDAWHYRDYVIRSLNEDKPWDQFIIEQIAGDELVAATAANASQLANQKEKAREALIATGFLRMAPDGSGSRPMNPEEARNQVITETIKIISTSLLGSSVACAECHHHRFDPIPQDDFYRLRAVLAPVYNTENWRNPNARRISLMSAEDRQRAEELEEKAKEQDQQAKTARDEVLQTVLKRVLESVPEERREFARTAYETPKKERTSDQETLLQDEVPMLGLLHPNRLHLFLQRFEDGNELKKTYEEPEKKAADIRKQKPQPELVRVAFEIPGQVPETKLFHRGDFNSPVGEPVKPGGLSLIAEKDQTAIESDNPDLPTTGRRLAFAQYLTNGKHPLVARVLVNRFWHHHFGRGIVETTGDFGKQGSQPSHPKLLDWLAADFMEHGWKLKRFHKLLVMSQTYRQSSLRRNEGETVDSDNRLLWRMPVHRLEAEAVRDTILQVGGNLQDEMFGPPIPVSRNSGGILEVGGGTVSEDKKEWKRSVYAQVRRTAPVAMLQAFDAPQMEPNCQRRNNSTVATQSLAMLNSQFTLEQSEAFAKRIQQEAGEKADAEALIKRAWQLAWQRSPHADELASAQSYLKQQTEQFKKDKVKNPELTALATLCQILVSSNEFLYRG